MNRMELEKLVARIAAPSTDHRFAAWLRKVDAFTSRRFGASVASLGVEPWRDWFDHGVAATAAGGLALRRAAARRIVEMS